jgi:hypothetical protein
MLLNSLLECFMMMSMYNKLSEAGRFGFRKKLIERAAELLFT